MLNRKVALYVPGTVGAVGGVPGIVAKTEQDRSTSIVARQFSNWFGGATVYAAEGYWASPTGELIVEPIKLVQAFTDSRGIEDHREHLEDLAGYIADIQCQASVAYEIDGEMFFSHGRTETKKLAA